MMDTYIISKMPANLHHGPTSNEEPLTLTLIINRDAQTSPAWASAAEVQLSKPDRPAKQKQRRGWRNGSHHLRIRISPSTPK